MTAGAEYRFGVRAEHVTVGPHGVRILTRESELPSRGETTSAWSPLKGAA